MANFFAIAAILISFFYTNSYAVCLGDEKEALLLFKKDLNDNFGRLSSWIPEVDCCKLDGIFCDSATGHVMELRLQNPGQLLNFSDPSINFVDYQISALRGKISPSLLKN